MLQQQTKAYSSQSQKSWYVADNAHNRNLCGVQPNIVGKDVLCKISVVNLPGFQKYKNILILKGFLLILSVLVPSSLLNYYRYLMIFRCRSFLLKNYKAIFSIAILN